MLSPAANDPNRKKELARKKKEPKEFGQSTRFHKPASRKPWTGLASSKNRTDDLGI